MADEQGPPVELALVVGELEAATGLTLSPDQAALVPDGRGGWVDPTLLAEERAALDAYDAEHPFTWAHEHGCQECRDGYLPGDSHEENCPVCLEEGQGSG